MCDKRSRTDDKPRERFANPIIPGSFPDPSICRVDDTWYLCNSSFEYFPGLPIHQSKDLINWELVGYGLHREDQVNGAINLIDVKSNDGLQAPTIRFHKGIFYIIATTVYRPPGTDDGCLTNFIITAEDVRGPWSLPHVMEGAPGIDPDIFFDDDGKVWYIGTHSPDKPNFEGEGELWCQEIDLSNWKLIGERTYLWRGACYGGVYVEGPHMYKNDGMYYLMAAEGGTGVNHSVVIAISNKVTGPFYPNDRNPILTSRHLSYDNWVHSTGHADLFQIPSGEWYMVMLGIRADDGPSGCMRSNMGRETYIAPVVWEREPMEWHSMGPARKNLWPVVAPETGRVEKTGLVPIPGTVQKHSHNCFRDDFDSSSLHLEWNFRRCPKAGIYSLTAKPGFLRLYAQPTQIAENTSCSLLGIRQRHSEFTYAAKMHLSHGNSLEAGISLFQKDDNFINFTIIQDGTSGIQKLQVFVAEREKKPYTVKEVDLQECLTEITFKVKSENHKYVFSYSVTGSNFEVFSETASDLLMSFGYTGAYFGLYCTTKGQDSAVTDFADFDWVEHEAFPRF
jgi:xylan 1,4-beta-xylosidase